jgi:hypothetical protein
VTWNGWPVPIGLSLGIVAIIGAVMLSIGIMEFQKSE